MEEARPANRIGLASRAKISNRLHEESTPGWLRLEAGGVTG